MPHYLQVHAADNVGIVVDPDGLRAGMRWSDGPPPREFIPQSHKIALVAIAKDQPILRYGEIIGHSDRPIRAGDWVREEMVRLPAAPALDHLPLATATPAALAPLDDQSFDGFRNADGSVGTKNILGIATTVQCVAPTVDYAIRRIKAELLPHYPNVDDAVALTHNYGCGVAIDAPDAHIPIRTLKHISLHPNINACPLVVSLGCEKLQPARLLGNDFPLLPDIDTGALAGSFRLR